MAFSILMLNHFWFRDELRQLGHNVIAAGWRPGGYDAQFPWGCSVTELLASLPSDFKPDRVIYWDDSALPSVTDLETLNIPSIFMSVDIHHHFRWHRYFAHLFSHTLVAQKDYIAGVLETGLEEERVSWFPLWASSNINPAELRDVDVSFRGTLAENLHPGRKVFLDTIAAHFQSDFGEGSFADLYARSKIVINEAVKGDVNFRVFEGMMSGALMVTPRTGNGLEELFKDGESIVLFEDGNIDDCIEKIRFYLEHEENRARIACLGRKLVLERHSLSARASLLENILKNVSLPVESVPLRPKMELRLERLRMLWIYIRKYHTYEIIEKAEDVLEELRSIMCSLYIQENEEADYESALFMIDAIASDLLGENSYKNWLESIATSIPNLPVVTFIGLAAMEEAGVLVNPEISRKLKEARSTMLRSFL